MMKVVMILLIVVLIEVGIVIDDIDIGDSGNCYS